MKSIDSLGVMTFKPWLPYHIETVKIDEAKIDYESNGFLHTLIFLQSLFSILDKSNFRIRDSIFHANENEEEKKNLNVCMSFTYEDF